LLREILEIATHGTFNVLDAAVRAGVKRVVAASSASVYGMAEEFPTTKRHHPYNNCTLYGAAKTFNEGLLRSFHDMYGLSFVALRYFNVYGPRMDIHGAYTEVLIRWMERIAAGLPSFIFGDGTQTIDFIYVEDVARANILAAESSAADEVFNVVSRVETSLNDLACELLRVMDSDLRPEYGLEGKVNPVPRRLADVSKATRLLGFEARVGLQDGLVGWWNGGVRNALGPDKFGARASFACNHQGRYSCSWRRTTVTPDHQRTAQRDVFHRLSSGH
jgi:UDP-glucose 4-epimerase